MNQFELNKQIEQFILKKDKASESYSSEDKKFIAGYSGSGGQGSKGSGGVILKRSELDAKFTSE